MRAVRLASKLCVKVQSTLSLSDEKQDKQDESPVTIADYGAQSIVAWVLQRESKGVHLPSAQHFLMVAEESSESLRAPEGRSMLERITSLVNSVVIEEDPSSEELCPEDIVKLIDLGSSEGGKKGKHWVLVRVAKFQSFPHLLTSSTSSSRIRSMGLEAL